MSERAYRVTLSVVVDMGETERFPTREEIMENVLDIFHDEPLEHWVDTIERYNLGSTTWEQWFEEES